jgi:hypothetical protein
MDFANEILGMYLCGEDRYYTGPANLMFSETPDPTLRNPEPADSVVSEATLYAEIPEDIPASPDISTLDPKSLGDTTPGKPEISAPDHPDIWDIDIEVLESEPELCHPDISRNFVLASTCIPLLTGYVACYRFSTRPAPPEMTQNPVATTRRSSGHLPKTRYLHPHLRNSIPADPLFRKPAHQPRRNPFKYPVYGFHQYSRPSHSRIALTQYECGKRALIRKKL